MSSSSHRKTDPQLRADDEGDDGVIFPLHADPTDDTPTIISKTHPLVDPKPAEPRVADARPSDARPAGSDKVTEITARAPDHLTNNLRGRRLAHFELIEPIGVGGMAAVLRARDTQLDRQVALKILPPEMAADPENVRRFHQEAKAAARLDHENIARVFFCGEDQGLHFIAFEFVEGENLRVLLDHRGRLPVAEAVRYILQVATGLEHASSRGVVHRDVKPSNIIVSSNGRAKLVDMGLARNMERQGEADLTQSGVTLGTFDYISPEQALEPREADARSDIYSLGCTFYHMLTGYPPVPEGTAAKKLHHHQHIAPVDPRQFNPDIPDDIAMILGRMMQKDARARYQRPLELVQHLMQVARKVGAADDLPEGVLFVDAPLPTGPRHRPALMAATSFLALAAIITGLALFPNDPQPTPVAIAPSPASNPVIEKKNSPLPVEISPPGTRPLPVPEFISNARQLDTALKDIKENPREAVIKVAGVIHLAELKNRSLQVNEPLRITPEDGDSATLIFDPDSASNDGNFIGLSILGGKITLEKVTIRVAATHNSWANPVAAIAVRGGHVTFKRCQFEQIVKPISPVSAKHPPIASLLIDAAANAPTVEVSNCSFGGAPVPGAAPLVGAAQVAVAFNGAADFHAVDCAFRPHAAFFQMRAGCESEKRPTIRVDKCSGHLSNGLVFRVDAGASANVIATRCLFARGDDQNPPEGLSSDSIYSDLIYQFTGSGAVKYSGQGNRYYHLNAYLSDGSPLLIKLPDFEAALGAGQAKLSGSEQDSQELAESPWLLAKPLLAEIESKAFQVRSELDGFGLQSCYWGDLDRQTLSLKANEKLFDPDYKGKDNRIFNDLKKACLFLVPKDVLLIKPGKDGREIEFLSRFFEDPIDITIKAFPKTAPVLTLGSTKKTDVAFFRVLDGKLRLEGLHFVLQPRKEIGALSVVQLGNSAQCTFERCVITLAPNSTLPLNVVSLIDAKDLMMPKPGPALPMSSGVEFNNSFVRGDGDFAGFDTSRRLYIALNNSLVVLSGSLVALKSQSEEPGSDMLGPQVKLDKSSIFTREPLFALSTTRTGKGLGCTKVDSSGCLHVALGKRPLVYLKATDLVSEQQVGKYVDWRGDHNVYARFDKGLEQDRPDEMANGMQLPIDQWAKLIGEPQAAVRTDLDFRELADPNLNLSQVTPDQCRPATELDPPAGCGPLPELTPLLKALVTR